MRVLILCGGLGTRLLPITKFCPKSLVSVHGQAFLSYILDFLSGQDIVLSLGYKAQDIKNYCKEKGYLCEYVVEPKPLGTGGALKFAEPFFRNNRKFMVLNGDTYIEEDLEKIYDEHNPRRDIATVLYAQSVIDGILRPAGVWVFSNGIFRYIKQGENISIEGVLERVKVRKIYSIMRYIDIGTLGNLRYCKENLLRMDNDN